MAGWIAVWGLASLLLGPLLGSVLKYGLSDGPSAAPSEDEEGVEETTSEQQRLAAHHGRAASITPPARGFDQFEAMSAAVPPLR